MLILAEVTEWGKSTYSLSFFSSKLLPISDAIKNIPGRESTATNQLIFTALLPALGFNTYFFEAKSEEKAKIKMTENDECILQNPVR